MSSLNITSADNLTLKCDSSYDPLIEIIKYSIQCAYLSFGAILIAYMLYVMMIKNRSIYLSNSFYKIFVFELVTSLYLILHDIFFGRLTMYITPLCPILGPYFSDHSYFLKLSMVSLNYVRASKSVCQIFLTFNRLTCVIIPTRHHTYWDKAMNSVIFLNCVLPIGAIWSLAISQVYANNNYGGFSPNYIRAIDWASLSRFQSIYLTISLFISTFNSLATLYVLKTRSHRVKNFEKTLCILTIFITVCFIFVAAIQYVWVFCTYCKTVYPSIYGIQFISYDVLNIGTPIMMVIVNDKLRSNMFPRPFIEMFHSHDDYTDSMSTTLDITAPLKCNTSFDPVVEMFKYAIQCVYLLPGAGLITYMLYVMMVKRKSSYLSNSYYKIFVFELVTSLYLALHDVFFGRLTLYVTPLCPIIGSFFQEHSHFLKFSMVSLNYVRASKSVCQIFLTFNRLTCVIFPMQHQNYWDKLAIPIIFMNFILPFGAIWSLMISQVYANNSYGGFSTNYIRAINWASLSRFQSIYLTISLIISTSNSLATLYGLKTRSTRLKNVERTLCIVTLFIAIGFVFVATIQYIWVFCDVCSIVDPSLYGIQFISYDVLSIGTPVMMIVVNEKLRYDMFPSLHQTRVTAISHSK